MSSHSQLNVTALIGAGVTVLGLFAAVAMGQIVASNDFRKLGMIFGAVAGITMVLMMGRNIWLLIPFCWPLTGKIQILPLPLNVQELAVVAATGFYVLQLVFKKPLNKPKTGWMELLLLLNLLWLGTVFLRNPVGVRAFGSDMLGGRPYFEVVIACCAFWVLTRTIIPAKKAWLFPILMAAGSLIVSVIGTLTTIFPKITPIVAPFYSGVDTSAYFREEFRGGGGPDELGRLSQLKGFGGQMIGVLLALFRPLTLLTPANLLPFLLFGVSMAALFLSGFRSAIIGTGIVFVLASYFWGGVQEAVRALFFALVAVILLVTAQAVGLELPRSAQRALSFLPGTWDETAVRDAEGTKEWRLDMWKTVLENPEKFLKSPIFGTGFGFSQADMQIQMAGAVGGQGYMEGAAFENQLITGAFHSGPLSTIRFVGIVGLILYYVLMIVMAVFSVRLVNRTRGSPFFYLAVFLACTAVYSPFGFTVIYGAFDSSLQEALFLGAMLRCVTESFEQWSAVKAPELVRPADLEAVPLPSAVPQ